MKNFDKLLKFIIYCELFLQLRTPSFEKIVNTLKEQLNYALRLRSLDENEISFGRKTGISDFINNKPT
jgi:hypothetical protein